MSVSTQEQQTEDMGLLPIVVQLQPVVSLSDDQLCEFCQVNRDLRIERNAQGELIIMPPAVSDMGDRNAELTTQLRNWAKRDGTGKSFDSSAGFRLPNGAVRSPDASWLPLARWNALSLKEKKQFAPLCPDFVVELRSESDRLRTVQAKMQEYLDNGAELGLLIDPQRRRVHVYRRNREAEVLDGADDRFLRPSAAGVRTGPAGNLVRHSAAWDSWSAGACHRFSGRSQFRRRFPLPRKCRFEKRRQASALQRLYFTPRRSPRPARPAGPPRQIFCTQFNRPARASMAGLAEAGLGELPAAVLGLGKALLVELHQVHRLVRVDAGVLQVAADRRQLLHVLGRNRAFLRQLLDDF